MMHIQNDEMKYFDMFFEKTKRPVFNLIYSYLRDCDESETSFSCKYKTNGKTTTAYSVKTEVEYNESKIKITENGSTYKLKYYTKNNNEYLKVKKEGSYEVKLSLSYDEEGNVVYTLVDND